MGRYFYFFFFFLLFFVFSFLFFLPSPPSFPSELLVYMGQKIMVVLGWDNFFFAVLHFFVIVLQ